MTEEAEHHLEMHGVRPTAVRLLVWQTATQQSETFSLADMERWMPHTERSSIFRALKLFADHHLLHIIDDGSGVQKYCVCRCENHNHINHIHFIFLLLATLLTLLAARTSFKIRRVEGALLFAFYILYIIVNLSVQ